MVSSMQNLFPLEPFFPPVAGITPYWGISFHQKDEEDSGEEWSWPKACWHALDLRPFLIPALCFGHGGNRVVEQVEFYM